MTTAASRSADTASLRVGIVGANPDRGWGTSAHLPALAALPRFKIVAVATTRKESAERTARAFGAPLAFDETSKLVEHPDVDIVAVTVKVPDHDQIIRAALAAGKHVFSEWPLAVDAARATALARLADATDGVRHVVGLQGHVAPGARFVSELIARGQIGEVLAVSLIASGGPAGRRIPQANRYTADPAAGATILSISTGHVLATLASVVGPFREISAVVARVNTTATIVETGETIEALAPDQVVLNGYLASGAVASLAIQGGVAPAAAGFELRIVGSEGTLTIRPVGSASIHIADWTVRCARADGSTEDLAVPDPVLPEGVPSGAPKNVALIYQELAAAIDESRPAVPSFGDATRHHRLLELIQRASDTGERHELLK